MEQDHWQVVMEALEGRRATDEQTLGSLAVLAERLERLKTAHPRLSGVAFSPEVEDLAARCGHVQVH